MRRSGASVHSCRCQRGRPDKDEREIPRARGKNNLLCKTRTSVAKHEEIPARGAVRAREGVRRRIVGNSTAINREGRDIQAILSMYVERALYSLSEESRRRTRDARPVST